MYTKVAQFKSPAALAARLAELGCELPVEGAVLSAAQDSPLAQPLEVAGRRLGNRFCTHPMEGWDANADGSPSPLTLRRWERFGASGAKLIWGGEAAAVQADGRANPRQTLATPDNCDGLARLREKLLAAHLAAHGTTDDLLIGLQLTHSGRYARPDAAGPAPRIAYHHPLLDPRLGIGPDDDSVVWSDDELERLIDRFVSAARMAAEVGFDFVDVKACHGYLLHEFLSARRRPGRFGGDLTGRSRVLCTIIERIRAELPALAVGVRLSVFDTPPFEPGADGGQAVDFARWLPYEFAFGAAVDDPLRIDLREPIELLRQLSRIGVAAVNLSAGSPYYNPHVQRPAIFPPSDGYRPPEDPLVGVWRQIDAARQCKQAVPELVMVGTGYTYLQDFLPHVAQGVVRAGWIDAVGLGRMTLSYPELPADVLAGRPLRRKLICRTFSDCTTAPRSHLVSGCYPLDEHYKRLPEAAQLAEIKAVRRAAAD
ncbi:MAG: NADH:flavin oxidoreductase [Pirellulales bacterium]|nr:NADH:flavin oxidoreductase [Pirellulales bacterium]